MSDRKCYTCECDLHEYSESKGHKGQCRNCYAHYKVLINSDPIRKAKVKARTLANRRLKKGLIIKTGCAHCDSDEAEMHHHDYNKPYDVSWLCKPCHAAFHSLENKVLFHKVVLTEYYIVIPIMDQIQ